MQEMSPKKEKRHLKNNLFSPENLLSLIKISTCLTVCWPSAFDDSKFKIFVFDGLCFLSFVSSILLIIPLLCSIYQDWNDPIVMSNSLRFTCAVSQIGMKIAVCRIPRHHLQVVWFRVHIYHFQKLMFYIFEIKFETKEKLN